LKPNWTSQKFFSTTPAAPQTTTAVATETTAAASVPAPVVSAIEAAPAAEAASACATKANECSFMKKFNLNCQPRAGPSLFTQIATSQYEPIARYTALGYIAYLYWAQLPNNKYYYPTIYFQDPTTVYHP
jgi:hypothetical protein